MQRRKPKFSNSQILDIYILSAMRLIIQYCFFSRWSKELLPSGTASYAVTIHYGQRPSAGSLSKMRQSC